jgi:hypothetical protein
MRAVRAIRPVKLCAPAWWLGLLLALGAGACGKKAAEPRGAKPAEPRSSPESAPAPGLSQAEAVSLAQAHIAPFKQQLNQALMEALGQGPMAAVDVCAKLAPELAERASSAQVQVGRSSRRLRNPKNAPRPWLEPLLDELAALPSAEGAQRVTPIEGGRYGYAEAIVLKPQCVICHGKDIHPELAAHIAERYPTDQATGFEPGQLRGVFWAEIAPANAQ